MTQKAYILLYSENDYNPDYFKAWFRQKPSVKQLRELLGWGCGVSDAQIQALIDGEGKR